MIRKVICVAAVLACLGCVAESTAPTPNDAALADRWNWVLPLGTVDPGCGPPYGPADPCPPPFLACTLTVAFGQYGSCYLANALWYNLSWRFETDGGLIVQGPTNNGTWGGTMVTGGTVFATFTMGGVTETLSEHIQVTRRSGWSWSGSIGGRQAVGTEIDICIPSDYNTYSGATASSECASGTANKPFIPTSVAAAGGFTVAQVSGSGPNGGLRYIASPSATIQPRGQVHIAWRPDHPGFDLNNEAAILCGTTASASQWYVNKFCYPEGEDSLARVVDYTRIHEGKHIAAGLASARLPMNDMHALLEPLVDSTTSALRSRADVIYQAAQTKVQQDLLAAHASMSPFTVQGILQRSPTFWLWFIGPRMGSY